MLDSTLASFGHYLFIYSNVFVYLKTYAQNSIKPANLLTFIVLIDLKTLDFTLFTLSFNNILLGFYLPPPQLSERFFRAIRLFRRPASNKTEQINFGSQQYVANSKIVNTRSTNFANKKWFHVFKTSLSKCFRKQIKIESQTEELDPVLQPRDFLKQVTDCALSDDIWD